MTDERAPAGEERLPSCLTCGVTAFDPLAGACGECGAEDRFVGSQWLRVPADRLPFDAAPSASPTPLRVWGDEMQWRHSARCAFERGGPECDCGLARFRAALTTAGTPGIDVEHVRRVTRAVRRVMQGTDAVGRSHDWWNARGEAIARALAESKS